MPHCLLATSDKKALRLDFIFFFPTASTKYKNSTEDSTRLMMDQWSYGGLEYISTAELLGVTWGQRLGGVGGERS